MSDGGWSLHRAEGLCLARCEPLDDLGDVSHAFSTRHGPAGASFDLGGQSEKSPAVAGRRRALMHAAGLGGLRPTVLRQVHETTVVDVGALDPGGPGPAADGVIALAGAGHGWAPAVRWADCVPLLLAAADGRAVAAVHAGWRGAASGIAARAVELLERRGIPPGELVAALGPAIGGCCYEVGRDVARAVARGAGVEIGAVATPGQGRVRLDLRRAVGLQLERAGLAPAAVHRAPWCTACSAELFFSYRRDGSGAGRQMACIGRAP